MADKKGMAALIVSKAKPEMPEAAPAEEMDPKHAAAEELMDAMQAKDPAAFAEAFQAMVDMCHAPEME